MIYKHDLFPDIVQLDIFFLIIAVMRYDIFCL